MKKLFSLILMVALVFSMASPASADSLGVSSRDDTIILSVPIYSESDSKANTASASALFYETDIEGILGPQSFYIVGDSTYILDTSCNRVIQYQPSSRTIIYDLDNFGFTGIQIACSDTTLYVLSTENELYAIERNVCRKLNCADILYNEAVISLDIFDDMLYVCVTENQSYEVTYKLDISNSDVIILTKFTGRVFDSSTRYVSELIPELEKLVGHQAKVTIIDIPTGSSHVIDLSSEHYIIGAQYLGKIGENYWLKVFEVSANEFSATDATESIWVVDSNDQLVGAEVLDAQYFSVINQTRSINGKIYHLNNSISTANIVLESSTIPSLSTYSTPLDIIIPATAVVESSETSPVAGRNLITRSQITTTAKSYLNHVWTCTAANISSSSSWAKPSYINGAGTYASVPYCWGGMHTLTQFNAGIASGGYPGQASNTLFNNTYGVDCSGYVGRCWGMTNKLYTGSVESYATRIAKSNLQEGDALYHHDASSGNGHIVLFNRIASGSSGTYVIYESTTQLDFDRVISRMLPATYFNSDIAVCYNGLY